ncbi:Eae-like protein, partial [Salmonella enterica subsp. enterica serovar Haifa]|nr:Eae-like protein [Salmonella enterica subsp. enterica serovar Haifa]
MNQLAERNAEHVTTIAALEARCAALASENAALKKSEVEFNEYCRRECEDVGDTWVDDFTETPATDAFLAEVRASARNEG